MVSLSLSGSLPTTLLVNVSIFGRLPPMLMVNIRPVGKLELYLIFSSEHTIGLVPNRSHRDTSAAEAAGR